MKSLFRILGTGFGLGYLPAFPGTIATLLGVLLWWFMKDLNAEYYVLLLVLWFPFGAWISEECEKLFRERDCASIVIDEILAFPLAMLMVPASFLTVLSAYLLFRLFDIFKPFPVSALEDLPRGYGVMADDYLAAALACGVLHLANLVFPFFPEEPLAEVANWLALWLSRGA